MNGCRFKAAQKEVEVLKTLMGEDKHNKSHCVRLLSSFMHKNHLCMVFEHFEYALPLADQPIIAFLLGIKYFVV